MVGMGACVVEPSGWMARLVTTARCACAHDERCPLPPAVVDHGVPEELVAAAFDAQRHFFALPLEQKLRIRANKYYRGYTPMAEETLDPSRSRRGDTHEGGLRPPPLQRNRRWAAA